MPNSGICPLGRPQGENQRKRKGDKFLDLAREVKKLWNMKVTVMPIVINALGMIPKGLVKGLEVLEIGQAETIQTTPFLRSAGILRRVLETRGDLLDSSERPSAYFGIKNKTRNE